EKSPAFKLESAVDFSRFSPNQDKPRLLSRGTNPKGLVINAVMGVFDIIGGKVRKYCGLEKQVYCQFCGEEITREWAVVVMENSVDCATAHSNSPDRELGTKCNSIILILCNNKTYCEGEDGESDCLNKELQDRRNLGESSNLVNGLYSHRQLQMAIREGRIENYGPLEREASTVD
ncbi:MAG: hypothetical protein Q7S74_02435, partial [Nanoarchaeota archaeon]|nr:hypothetical protein [Nanoarchaeota archaeon]